MKRNDDRRGYTPGNAVELVPSGDVFLRQSCDLVRRAQKVVHAQFYIFRVDSCGKALLDCFAEVAQRGVQVHLLIDALGSFDFPDSEVDKLTGLGIEVSFFRPLRPGKKGWGWGRRLHRKVISIDAAECIVAGMNVGDEYMSSVDKEPWLDFGAHISGPAAQWVHWYCEELWRRSQSRYLTTYAVFPDELQGPSTERGVLVRPLVNYWFRRQRFIYSSYLRAIASAKERIVIANSYFLPNTGLRRELLRARRRGVRVQLLISRKSDVKVVDWAMHSVYPGFLKAGVEIYEWLPSVLHAKVAVVDGIWSTIGSFNMDAVSLFVNIEMNVNILDSSIGRQLEERLQKVIETQCQRVTEKSLARIGVIQLVWSALIYQLYRMITNVVMLFRATADAPFEAGDRL